MKSNWVAFVPPPTTGSWLIVSQGCGRCVCVDLCVHRNGGRELGKMRFSQRFSYPDRYLFSAQSENHSLCLDVLLQKHCCNTYCRVSEHTCLCQALSFPCPWTTFSGTCWETVSHKEHESYCQLACAPHRPERGQALRSKKSNNSLYKNVTHPASDWAQAQKYIHIS